MSRKRKGSGGLIIPPKMLEILEETPGYISTKNGGQKLVELYSEESKNFNPSLLSDFGLACFIGFYDEVKSAIESGRAPNLEGTETPFKHGYAALVILGAQRLLEPHPGSRRWADVLSYLLANGVPADVPDIIDYTALDPPTMNQHSQLGLARILLEAPNPADPNHRNRRGFVPIFAPMMSGIVGAVDLLMEYGADLDIADADGFSPGKMYISFGPEVTATVRRWLRKRNGEEAPLDEKICGNPQCPVSPTPGDRGHLKCCSRCKTMRYCSIDCQKIHWREHKVTCIDFSTLDNVTIKPCYESSFTKLLPMATIVRHKQGIPTAPIPASHLRVSHVSKSLADNAKVLIIKVQVPPAGSGAALLVYTKKRDFVCTIRKEDNVSGYNRIEAIVRDKGTMGLKAYFTAELRSKEELVVKVKEVLAEQPF